MATFMILFLFVASLLRTTTSLCPLLGPDFPPPRNISQNSGFRKAVDSFSNIINQLLNTNSSSPIPFDSSNTTFSINIFSKFTDTPLYEYHYTAPLFANGSNGTKKIDGDTIYRIGSISKLFTVFAFLIEKGDANFNDPVTKYVPELRYSHLVKQKGVVNAVQWDDVTLGALASQMSGIGRDCKWYYYLGLFPTLIKIFQMLLVTLLGWDHHWFRQACHLLMHQMCHIVVSVYQGFQHAIELVCPILKLLHMCASLLYAFFVSFLQRLP